MPTASEGFVARLMVSVLVQGVRSLDQKDVVMREKSSTEVDEE